MIICSLLYYELCPWSDKKTLWGFQQKKSLVNVHCDSPHLFSLSLSFRSFSFSLFSHLEMYIYSVIFGYHLFWSLRYSLCWIFNYFVTVGISCFFLNSLNLYCFPPIISPYHLSFLYLFPLFPFFLFLFSLSIYLSIPVFVHVVWICRDSVFFFKCCYMRHVYKNTHAHVQMGNKIVSFPN